MINMKVEQIATINFVFSNIIKNIENNSVPKISSSSTLELKETNESSNLLSNSSKNLARSSPWFLLCSSLKILFPTSAYLPPAFFSPTFAVRINAFSLDSETLPSNRSEKL